MGCEPAWEDSRTAVRRKRDPSSLRSLGMTAKGNRKDPTLETPRAGHPQLRMRKAKEPARRRRYVLARPEADAHAQYSVESAVPSVSVSNNLRLIPFDSECRVKWHELEAKFCRECGRKLRKLDVPRPAILATDLRLFLS